MARGICELRKQIEEQTGRPVEIRSFRESELSHNEVEKMLDKTMRKSLRERIKRMDTIKLGKLVIGTLVVLGAVLMLLLFVIF